jgi:flagellar FliL protein
VLVPAALLLNSLLVAGVLGVLLLRPAGAAKEAKHEEGAKEGGEGGEHGEHGASGALGTGPSVKLPDFVVRLRNPDMERFAKFTFELEVGTEKDKEEMATRLPLIRDAFISYLSDRTAEELRGSEGLERLKKELFKKAVDLTSGVKVRALYVTDFVVQ